MRKMENKEELRRGEATGMRLGGEEESKKESRRGKNKTRE